MLQQLHIQNYAIIDKLKINFTSHLNIITGETGAGKSILMGALGLILGDRADTSSLLDKKSKCIVEGQFKTSNQSVSNFFKENDLDEESELIIRREISPNGRSRAFINDTPVTLTQLKELTGLLVDLHRQFDIQQLNNKDFQLAVLDALAAHENILADYHKNFSTFRSVKSHLQTLRAAQEEANKEFDYHQFLFNELDQANFHPDEIEELEAELKLMSNAENIKDTLSSAVFSLNEGEEPLLQHLRNIISKIGTLKDFMPALSELNDRLQSTLIELKDITNELDALNADVSFSGERMAEVNDRMSLAYTLLKKHHAQTTSDLLQIKDDLDGKMQKVTDLSLEIEKAEKQEKELLASLKKTASVISENRKKQIPSFTKKVNELLVAVGMPNAALKVDMKPLPEPSDNGTDEVEFLFNANKTSFQPLRKVASGGELSRLMLIIKSLVARSVNLPTLIFDEIDTGISGEAARQVGIIIKDISANHQVLLITHQPQIAAKAYTHFFVYKEAREGKILTAIRKLTDEERVEAIATMLSGDKPTEAAFKNAREMMN